MKRKILVLFMCLLVVLAGFGCESSTTTGPDGDTADGDATDGDAVDGDAVDGDAVDGDAVDGDVVDGDVVDGDAVDGDAVDGDAADGDVVDGDAADGDAADGDADLDSEIEADVEAEAETEADYECEPVPTNCVDYCEDNIAYHCQGLTDEHGCGYNDWTSEDCLAGTCQFSDVTFESSCVVVDGDIEEEAEVEAEAEVPANWHGDDFEDGNFDGWETMGTNYTAVVNNSTAANGSTYSLQITKNIQNEHYHGLQKSFTAYQPCEVSFWVYSPSCAAGFHDYFALKGPDSGNVSSEIAYFKIAGSLLQMNYSTLGTDLLACTDAVWFHVSISLNWTNKTMDVYVDGTLKADDLSFQNQAAVALDLIQVWNWSNGAVGRWDEIKLFEVCN